MLDLHTFEGKFLREKDLCMIIHKSIENINKFFFGNLLQRKLC